MLLEDQIIDMSTIEYEMDSDAKNENDHIKHQIQVPLIVKGFVKKVTLFDGQMKFHCSITTVLCNITVMDPDIYGLVCFSREVYFDNRVVVIPEYMHQWKNMIWVT